VRRYGATVNPAFRAAVERLKLVALGLAETTSGNPLEEVFATVDPERVNAALRAASPEEVAEAYRLAGEVLPLAMPTLLAAYAVLAGIAEPLATVLSKRDAEDTASLLSALHDLISADPTEFAAMLRLPYTLIIVYVRKLGPAAVATLYTKMGAALQHLFALLMAQMEDRYRAVMQAALATAINPVIGPPDSLVAQGGAGEQPTPDDGEEPFEQSIR
jgi:hypothetical protein